MARPVDTKLVFYRISAFFIIINASLSLPTHALMIPHLLTIEVQRLHPNHSEELQQKPIGGLFLQLEWINNWSRSHVRFLLNCICYVYKEAVKWIGTRACYIFKAKTENVEGNYRLRSKMGTDWTERKSLKCSLTGVLALMPLCFWLCLCQALILRFSMLDSGRDVDLTLCECCGLDSEAAIWM